jgi:hypothetical protein
MDKESHLMDFKRGQVKKKKVGKEIPTNSNKISNKKPKKKQRHNELKTNNLKKFKPNFEENKSTKATNSTSKLQKTFIYPFSLHILQNNISSEEIIAHPQIFEAENQEIIISINSNN